MAITSKANSHNYGQSVMQRPLLGYRNGYGLQCDFPTDAAQIGVATGYTPDHIYTFKEGVGAAVLDKVGSVDLSVNIDPARNVETPFAGHTCCGFDESVERLVAASADSMEIGTSSLGFLSMHRWGAHPGGIYSSLGTFNFTTGYTLRRKSDGTWNPIAKDGTTQIQFTTTMTDPTDDYALTLFYVDNNSSKWGVGFRYHNKCDVETDDYTIGDNQNSVVFQLNLTNPAVEHDCLWMAVFTGTDAEWYGQEATVLNRFGSYL